MDDSPAKILPADPRAGWRAHEAELRAALERMLASGAYILGPEVGAFEAEFSEYQGGGYTIGVANGTEALELALAAAGVGPGDRVATVANTVTATVAAIVATGAEPVYVEIDPTTLLMAPAALAEVLARQAIKAVVPVHLYGYPADMTALTELAVRHGAVLVEDCAQAHGARVGGRRAGAWGAAAAFSFYPTKNLGALGDGGAVFTRDPALAEVVRARRQYGWRQRYVAEGPGRNSRLDELQAALLRVKLRHLDADNARRAALAGRYLAAFAATELRLPPPGDARHEPVWHQFSVRSPRREAWLAHLATHGVLAGVLYPVPVHRQPAHARPELSLPHTEQACAEVFNLPVHPGLSEADVERVIAAVLGFG
jgi:dTDP-4-amino-4,6-dideoxygalactose transaminase